MIEIKLTEKQAKDLLILMERTPLTGNESFLYVDIYELIHKAISKKEVIVHEQE